MGSCGSAWHGTAMPSVSSVIRTMISHGISLCMALTIYLCMRAFPAWLRLAMAHNGVNEPWWLKDL